MLLMRACALIDLLLPDSKLNVIRQVNLAAYGNCPFSIETNGRLSSSTLQLDKGPQHILEQMAASIDAPPPPAEMREQTQQPPVMQNATVISDVDQILWGFRSDAHHGQPLPAEPSSLNRDVLHFLQNVDFDEIKQRKLDRIHATAAALVARRAYKFLAVDGTGLGWSSASLAVCLSRLTDVHEEHKSQLRESFYPFRLVLGSDVKVDAFGGNIHINPTRTNIQWLDTLMAVTDDNIRALKRNKKELEGNLSQVEDAFGVRCVKGFSCEPEDYHRCIRQLALDCHRTTAEGDETSLAASSKAKLVVESAQACRRPKLRKDGSLEISANMGANAIRRLLAEYTTKASELMQKKSEQENRCQEIVSRAMYDFGVQKVREESAIVTSDQMANCLSTLLTKGEAEKDQLRGYLAGQSISVAGRGHLCHLGDDGSVVIPVDCS